MDHAFISLLIIFYCKEDGNNFCCCKRCPSAWCKNKMRPKNFCRDNTQVIGSIPYGQFMWQETWLSDRSLLLNSISNQLT